MCSARLRRGYTIGEMLVMLPMVLLLVGLLFYYMVTTTQTTARLTAQAQLQEAALAILAQMQRDLARTQMAGVAVRRATPADSLSALCIQRVEKVTPSGIRQWESGFVVYAYLPSSHSLVRREWFPPPPLLGISLTAFEATRPTEAQLLRLASDESTSQRLVSGEVRSLAITSDAPDGFLGEPLVLTVELSRRTAANTEVFCKEARSFTLRF